MMKNSLMLVVILCLCSGVSLYGVSVHSLGLKLDLRGNHEFSGTGGSEEYDVEKGSGLSFVFESLSDQHEWAFGFGFEFFKPHEIDVDNSDPAFSFLPLYFIISTAPDGAAVFSGHFGYSISFTGNGDYKGDAELSGGIYTGVGIGHYFEHARIELRYSLYQGEAEYEGLGEINVTQREFSFVVAFLF